MQGMKILAFLMFGLPLVAACPTSIKCTYHNQYYVSKAETEWKNGKEYGIYEHQYIDERGKNRICRVRMECP
jgi:hypothetical protein